MIIRFVLFLLLVAPLAADTLHTPGPIGGVASAEQVENWTNFSVAPAVDGTLLNVDFQFTGAAPRIDVFARHGGVWKLAGSYAGASPLRAPLPVEKHIGVLLRDQRRRNVYAWGEADGTRDTKVTLRWFRTIQATLTGQMNSAAVFVQGAEPITGGSEIRFVPLGAAIFCGYGGELSSCRVIGETESKVDVSVSSADTRMLRVDVREFEIAVLTPGSTNVRARLVPSTQLRAGQWVAIGLRDETWSNVVLDRHSAALAIERLNASGLPPLPSFAPITSQPSKGVIVRPLIGKDHDRVEKDARLYFYEADTTEVLSRIPIAVASSNADGLFIADELPSGSYRLRLISAAAASGPAVESLTPGVPVAVVFPSGPVVRGRAVRTSGGGPSDPTTIELVKRGVIGNVPIEVSDMMRATTAASDGSFHLVVPSPGPYRLRITWGSAGAERDFELRGDQAEADLGEIALTIGPTVRGTVTGCAGGTLRLAALPDVNKLEMPFFDFQRVGVDDSDRFLSNSLRSGRWAVNAECGKRTVMIEPSTINLPDQGEVIIDFQIVKPL